MRVNLARSSEIAGSGEHDLARRWGVKPGPWLKGVRVRILIVVDGRVDLGKSPEGFGLGFVLDAIRDRSFAWWVRFHVDVARRDEGSPLECPNPGPYEERYLNFRFTQPGFDLDDYDQVWLFGDYPGNRSTPSDDDIPDPGNSPLSNAELRVLAEWMDRGGGVFAAGDHDYLGASMCSRVPRVRTMRKWTHAQGVPPQYGPSRHNTLQQAPGGEDDTEAEVDKEREEDMFPQPIEPVFRRTGPPEGPIGPLIPHPLLCAPSGVIDRFPDHMHEGEVIEADEVELQRPLGIPGYEGSEYPPFSVVEDVGEPVPTQPAGALPGGLPLPGPRPEVIAYGRTTPTADPKRYGLVSVYDGDTAAVGRVVVDSTWHHWFSMNLVGLRIGNPAAYRLMLAYYRNVGLWLARSGQRAAMLSAAVWGVVVSDPMAFPVALRRRPWEVGAKAVDVIGRTATQCILIDLPTKWVTARALEAFFEHPDAPRAEPFRSCLPVRLLVRAIVGGIGARLLEPAFEYHHGLVRGKRPLVDPDAIARETARGAEEGYRALVAAVMKAPTANKELADRLAKGFRRLSPESITIPVETVPLRLVAERLQLPDPTDPALADGLLTLTARAKLAGSVVAIEVIADIEVPPFEPRGALVQLDLVLLEEAVQAGETLTVEILEGERGIDSGALAALRFADTLQDDPSTWVGTHSPAASQTWRLWYRLELVDDHVTAPAT